MIFRNKSSDDADKQDEAEGFTPIDISVLKNVVSAGVNQYKAFKDADAAIAVLESRQNYISEITNRISVLERVYSHKEQQIVEAEAELEAAQIEAQRVTSDAQASAKKLVESAQEQAKLEAAGIMTQLTGAADNLRKQITDDAAAFDDLDARIKVAQATEAKLNALVGEARKALGA